MTGEWLAVLERIMSIRAKISAQSKFNEWLENKDCYLILNTSTILGRDTEVIEIAIISLHGKIFLNTLIKPVVRPITRNNKLGITNEMIQGAPSWVEIWPQIHQIIKEKVILIYNADDQIASMFCSLKAHRQDALFERIHDEMHTHKSDCVRQEIQVLKPLVSYPLLPSKKRAVDGCLATLEIIKNNYNPDHLTKLEKDLELLEQERQQLMQSINRNQKLTEIVDELPF